MSAVSQPEMDPLVEKSSLYQEFLAEREEVLRHKWISSEQEGKDVGFEHALFDWLLNHRSEWRAERAKSPRS